MTSDLFESDNETMAVEPLGAESFVLYGAALPFVDRLLPALDMIQSVAPFRHMVTPGDSRCPLGSQTAVLWGGRRTAGAIDIPKKTLSPGFRGQRCPVCS
jgi:hypothetical protein